MLYFPNARLLFGLGAALHQEKSTEVDCMRLIASCAPSCRPALLRPPNPRTLNSTPTARSGLSRTRCVHILQVDHIYEARQWAIILCHVHRMHCISPSALHKRIPCTPCP